MLSADVQGSYVCLREYLGTQISDGVRHGRNALGYIAWALVRSGRRDEMVGGARSNEL